MDQMGAHLLFRETQDRMIVVVQFGLVCAHAARRLMGAGLVRCLSPAEAREQHQERQNGSHFTAPPRSEGFLFSVASLFLQFWQARLRVYGSCTASFDRGSLNWRSAALENEPQG